METTPLISTIITTYKRPKLLKRAIESVIHQTYSNLQICVYDNASGDETEEIVQALSKNDSRIKYHKHSQNIQMIENYRHAIAQVNTPYFSLLSDDDFLYPWFYETNLQSFSQFPQIAFATLDTECIDENGNLLSRSLSKWEEGYYDAPVGFLKMLSENGRLLYPIGILFDHSKVKNIHPDWPNILRWDSDYTLQIASRHPFAIKKKIGCAFLCHEGGYSTGHCKYMLKSAKGVKTFIRSTDRLCKNILKTSNLSQSVKKEVQKLIGNMMHEEIFPYVQHHFTNSGFKEIVRVINIYLLRFFLYAKIFKLLKVRIRKSFID
jgi:glycosyltransferase involved in cell wall biosynthesis